ncbi:unnamed protein product [Rotaria sp. Silwood2]|nr:unnamed protein product [Rotaria sp. Silwood2]CAF3163569.1 unnamed protein product [Rotaria sp. Silwood2]CAF4549702.1 unnamed protein product [Rotaria sp. Silwood2]CAF4556748.1 unnamed protein product [Rotaria sp. Silwood2]
MLILLLHPSKSYSHCRHRHHSINVTKVRSVHIAHCMTGTPRTLYKEEVYTTYKRQALDILGGDLFVVLECGNDTEFIHGSRIEYHSQEDYSAALKYLSPRKLEWVPLGEHFGAVDDRAGYAKWKRCLKHIENAEEQNGIKYDFIVRSRPDLYFVKSLPSPDKLPNDSILINPYYECLEDIPSGYNYTWGTNLTLCDEKNHGLSDIFAIVPRALADYYMGIGYATFAPVGVCGQARYEPECLIKAVLVKEKVKVEMWPFIVKIMRPARFCHSQAWNKYNSWC